MYIILSGAATNAAISKYGDAVAVSKAAATATTTPTTTAPIVAPFAVVAQRRAPTAGDMGARPIYGIFGNWCIMRTNPRYSSSDFITIDNRTMVYGAIS